MVFEFLKPEKFGYTIYGKSGCPGCTKAKKFLTSVNAAANIIDCDEYLIERKSDFLFFIEGIVGKPVKTFPMIFYEGEFVGGYDEVEKHYYMFSAFSNNTYF
jgi:glutaredoxin